MLLSAGLAEPAMLTALVIVRAPPLLFCTALKSFSVTSPVPSALPLPMKTATVPSVVPPA